MLSIPLPSMTNNLNFNKISCAYFDHFADLSGCCSLSIPRSHINFTAVLGAATAGCDPVTLHPKNRTWFFSTLFFFFSQRGERRR